MRNKGLGKNGRRAAYNIALEGLRRTNPKEPLLQIRAWFAVARIQMLMFGRWAKVPYVIVHNVVALVGLGFALAYWLITLVFWILFSSEKKIGRGGPLSSMD